MNARALGVLCSVGSPLILSGAASAGFVGLKAVQKVEAQALGLFVCNVYAVFDRPDDEMVFATGDIIAKNGFFFQHPMGHVLTANPAVTARYPADPRLRHVYHDRSEGG